MPVLRPLRTSTVIKSFLMASKSQTCRFSYSLRPERLSVSIKISSHDAELWQRARILFASRFAQNWMTKKSRNYADIKVYLTTVFSHAHIDRRPFLVLQSAVGKSRSCSLHLCWTNTTDDGLQKSELFIERLEFTFGPACNTLATDRDVVERVSESSTSIHRVGARRIKPACKLNIISVYQQL